MQGNRCGGRLLQAVKLRIFFAAVQNAFNIVAGLCVWNFVDVGKIFAPIIFFHPIVNVTASGIVSRQSQHVVAVEFVFKLGKVPRAITNICFGVAQIFYVVGNFVGRFAKTKRENGNTRTYLLDI